MVQIGTDREGYKGKNTKLKKRLKGKEKITLHRTLLSPNPFFHLSWAGYQERKSFKAVRGEQMWGGGAASPSTHPYHFVAVYYRVGNSINGSRASLSTHPYRK